MLIKSLRLKNFQSHADSLIKFSRHLNAIIGSSRAGKSAILRSIFQVFDNSIKWEHCIRWDTEEAKILIEGNNDSSILRTKSNTKNEVTVNGVKEAFIGAQVPETVLDLMNITEFNIQKQREMFFMIDMKPSALSKALNTVSGLSMIDKTIKEAAQRIRDAQTEIRLNRVQQTNVTLAISDLKFIIEADAEYKKLEDMNAAIQKKSNKYGSIKLLCESMENEARKLDYLLPATAMDDLEKIKEALIERKRLQVDYWAIKEKVTALSKYEKDSAELIEFPMDQLEILYQSIERSRAEKKAIEMHMQALHTSTISAKVMEDRVKSAKELLSAIPVCPTCERPL